LGKARLILFESINSRFFSLWITAMKQILTKFFYLTIAFVLGLILATQAYAQSSSKSCPMCSRGSGPVFDSPSTVASIPPAPQANPTAPIVSTQPVYSQPVYSQPVYSQPVYSQPVSSQRVYSQRANYSAPAYRAAPVYRAATTYQPVYSSPRYYRLARPNLGCSGY
jgi:hypothetical protein